VVSANDYYPFGSLEPYRTYSEPGSSAYRHGFNGKEQDNEVKGTGNQIDYGMRVYDPRLGRFLSVDPMQKKFGYYSPYQFAGNKPIMAKDLDGLEPQETITVGEEAIGKTALRVAWKEGNIGGANVANPPIIYTLAQDGIAYPKGLLPGHTAHEDEEAHTMNDNESIFTSWTSDKRTARHFASWGTAGLLFLRDLKNDPTTP